MNQSNHFPHWFLWLWERGLLFTLGSLVLVMLVVLLGLIYVEQRLSSIQDRFQAPPPSNFAPPELNAYRPDGITEQDLPIQQTLYVPTHSHIYHLQGRPFSLEVTLSVRNTERQHPIYVSAVDYYNSRGELKRKYLDQLVQLDPLESIEFLVEATDSVGGSSATFLVTWHAAEEVEPPLVEAVMVGTLGTQGIAFSSEGRPLTRANRQRPE